MLIFLLITLSTLVIIRLLAIIFIIVIDRFFIENFSIFSLQILLYFLLNNTLFLDVYTMHSYSFLLIEVLGMFTVYFIIKNKKKKISFITNIKQLLEGLRLNPCFVIFNALLLITISNIVKKILAIFMGIMLYDCTTFEFLFIVFHTILISNFLFNIFLEFSLYCVRSKKNIYFSLKRVMSNTSNMTNLNNVFLWLLSTAIIFNVRFYVSQYFYFNYRYIYKKSIMLSNNNSNIVNTSLIFNINTANNGQDPITGDNNTSMTSSSVQPSNAPAPAPNVGRRTGFSINDLLNSSATDSGSTSSTRTATGSGSTSSRPTATDSGSTSSTRTVTDSRRTATGSVSTSSSNNGLSNHNNDIINNINNIKKKYNINDPLLSQESNDVINNNNKKFNIDDKLNTYDILDYVPVNGYYITRPEERKLLIIANRMYNEIKRIQHENNANQPSFSRPLSLLGYKNNTNNENILETENFIKSCPENSRIRKDSKTTDINSKVTWSEVKVNVVLSAIEERLNSRPFKTNEQPVDWPRKRK